MTSLSPIAPLLYTDFYKVGHERMMPKNTQYIYSNWTNRGSRLEGVNGVVHFGLRAYIQEFLMDAFEPFFSASENEVADAYQEFMDSTLGPGLVGVEHIRKLHRKGYIPLRFKAVPEGTVVPLRVPSFTIENTDPDFYWVTNYVETALSASVWHPSTTATIALQYRKLLDEAAIRTTGSTDGVDFQGHDFSFRGQTSIASAQASGAGHLTSFLGTDSVPAVEWIQRFYPGDNGFIAGSVPATEHSVMTAGTSYLERDEEKMYSYLLDSYPSGILSVVSDTFDLWKVLTETLPSLHDKIVGRDGKLVIRPDSGNPVDILTGEVLTAFGELLMFSEEENKLVPVPEGYVYSPKDKGVIELLWDEFGGTVNEQGYKVLDSHVGAIYGDSITLERAKAIIDRLEDKGFASTNVVLGIGSFTYQYVTRDTFSSAIKATWAQVDGVGRDMMKDPVTDNGTKKSATGRLAVVRDESGELTLIEKATPDQEASSLLETIWEDGKFITHQSFADVRRVLRESTI